MRCWGTGVFGVGLSSLGLFLDSLVGGRIGEEICMDCFWSRNAMTRSLG